MISQRSAAVILVALAGGVALLRDGLLLLLELPALWLTVLLAGLAVGYLLTAVPRRRR